MEEAIKRINEAKVNKLNFLDLSALDLIEIPSEISILKNELSTLILKDNQISNIHLLSIFTNLTELNLVGNLITDINPLSQLTNLKKLDIWYNQITNIASLKNLFNLTSLNLGGNRIIDLEPLRQLSTLVELDLRYNQLKNISPLISLYNLSKLDLRYNQLIDINPLSMLTELTVLNLGGNNITDFRSLTQLPKLRELSVKNTHFTNVQELRELIKIPKLNILSIDENETLDIPTNIIRSRDAKAISSYIEQIFKGRKEQNKFKLLVVGEGRCGKSSIIDKFKGRKFIEGKKITKGIKFETLPLAFSNTRNIELSIWDFGGQEIQHSMHENFITKALVLIVCDLTEMKNEKKMPLGNLAYWTNYIAKDSFVIIALTKSDEVKADLVAEIKKTLKEKYRKFPTIVCSSKTGDGIKLLLETICKKIQETKEYDKGIPISWDRIGDQLEKKLEETGDKISFDEYKKMCFFQEEQYTLQRLDQQQSLLEYLDSIGTIKYFKNKKRLSNKIYKTSWIADNLYLLIQYQMDAYEFNENNGTYTLKQIARIFGFDLPSGEESLYEILDIFTALNFCFEANADTYIFPEFLNDTPLDYAYWDEKNNLCAEITYNILPRSIIIKFICEVKNSGLIFDANKYWRSGVVIKDKENDCLGFIYAENVCQTNGKIKIMLKNSKKEIHNLEQLNRCFGKILHIFNSIHKESFNVTSELTVVDEVLNITNVKENLLQSGTDIPVTNLSEKLFSIINDHLSIIQSIIEEKKVNQENTQILQKIKFSLEELKQDKKQTSLEKQSRLKKIFLTTRAFLIDIGVDISAKLIADFVTNSK